MKNITLAGWIVMGLLGAIVVGVFWYIFFAPESVPPQTSQQPVTLPGSATVTPGLTQPPSTAPLKLMIATQTKGTVTTNDFIRNGETIPDDSNPGNYLLAGNLGSCYGDQTKCQAAAATGFVVFYYSAPQSFIIGLTEEPIGQSRFYMEQFMLKTLGITKEQMCSLNYHVGVTSQINETYAGKNLGFSFCPGAIPLPQ